MGIAERRQVSAPPGASRIALINFTGIRANWGCQATSWEWLKFINSAFPADRLPDVALIPLLPRHAADQAIERDHLNGIYDGIEAVAEGRPEKAEKLAFLEAICRTRYGAYADAVAGSDVVFFQAEGTMTGTDFVRGARLILLPFVAKHAWGKPVYAFNHTVFMCDGRFAKAAAAAFNSFDLNAVREPISFSAARANGMNPVYLIPDTAFLTEPALDARLPELGAGKYFAVTGSAYPAAGVHERIFAVADRVRRETGLVPVIAASTKADHVLVALAQQNWPDDDYEVIPYDVGYAAVAHALRSCAFILGGRYHLAIVAACVGTPAVQLAGNTYKNEGLSAMLGGLAPVRDPADMETIMNDVVAIVRNGDNARRQLADRRESIRASLAAARAWLSGTLAGQAPPIPDSFVNPPGVAIDHRLHVEPYCTAARAQAESFRYSDRPQSAMGDEPRAGNILPAVTASCLAGQAASLAMLRQLGASYPEIRRAVAEPAHPLRQLTG